MKLCTGKFMLGLFAEHDFIAEAIIQDLMFYQSRERRRQVRDSKGDAQLTSCGTPAGQIA